MLSHTGRDRRWITPPIHSLMILCVRFTALLPQDIHSNILTEALDRIQTIKSTSDFQFWVGETNWPTGGAKYGDAVPSTENAATYWKESVCPMRHWGVNIFIFSAFDEEWKPAEKDNSVEKHWGVFRDDGKPKYDLSC